MKKQQNITRLIVIMPIIFITLTILSSMYISIDILEKHFADDVSQRSSYEIKLQKEYIKNQIDSAANYIKQKKTETISRLEEKLKNRVYMGYELMSKTYEENKDLLSQEELQYKILETLRKVRFGQDGYLFIANIKSDKEVIAKLTPSSPNIEGRNVYALKDAQGKHFVEEFVSTVLKSKNNEGFSKYSWYKLSQKEQSSKLSFLKLFKPYNWYIGYGEYYEDFEQSIKIEAKKRLDEFTYGKDGYIWTHNTEHILLQHPYRDSFIGTNRADIKDKIGNHFVQQFITTALKNKEGGYVEYYWNKPNQKNLGKKIAYVKHIPQWNWVIGTGFYVEDVVTSFEKFKSKKEEDIQSIIYDIFFVSSFMLLGSIIISLIVSKRVNLRFFTYEKELNIKQEELEISNNSLEKKVNEKTQELQTLNEALETKIEERLLEIKAKDAKLLEQTKMVALGEMIGNIAHQWRQPLSAISTAASGIQIKKEFNDLSDEELIEFTKGIVLNSNYLSQVIEDFKNYIKDEKVNTKFNINDAISKSLSIVDSSIHRHNLELIKDLGENIIVENYINELVQAIVNIINNSKDAFSDNNTQEEDRFVFIKTYKEKEHAIISIQDSAGGIKDEVLPKIFEPYFTTKNQTQGTGLGLYMTYNIVVNSMRGQIKVKNVQFEYEKQQHQGVKFEILLPL